MAEDYLWDLVRIAARIIQLDQLEGELTDKREWQAGKDEWEARKEQFHKLRAEYVDALLGDAAPSDGVVDEVQGQLTSLREGADPSWNPAFDYTQENLLPYLTKEAGKSPRMRKAWKVAPFVAAALAAVVYFGIAIFSGTPVTEGIDTRKGLQQRAAAFEKVVRYDEFMGTHIRKGGWLKGILFWPIEPDPYEIKGAAEFAGLAVEGQPYAKGCGSVADNGNTLSKEQISMVSDVADYIQREDVRWEEPPLLTVVTGLERADKC